MNICDIKKELIAIYIINKNFDLEIQNIYY